MAPIHLTQYLSFDTKGLDQTRRFAVKIARTLLLTFICVFFVTEAKAFMPSELIQWNQEQRIRVNISGQYFFLNNSPLQVGLPDSKRHANTLFGTQIQYRIWEDSDLGKLEGYLGSGLSTGVDIFDLLNLKGSVGYTLKTWRLEVGVDRTLNIGRNHGKTERGLKNYWVGVSKLILDDDAFMFDVYGNYFFKSNDPAVVSDYPKQEKQRMLEFGTHMSYKILPYLTITGAPFLLLDTKLEIGSVGIYPVLRYDISKHWQKAPSGLSVDLSGLYRRNVKERDENRYGVAGRTKDREELMFGVNLHWELGN